MSFFISAIEYSTEEFLESPVLTGVKRFSLFHLNRIDGL